MPIMLTKKTVKNQITLPKKIVEQFPGTDYFDAQVESGKITLTPVNLERIEQVHEKMAGLGISEQDIQDAVSWARGSKH